MECETFLLFIPYKWGVAIHGTLRSISVSRRVDEALQQRHSDLRLALNSVPTGVLYADLDRRFVPTNGTVLGAKKSKKQPDQ
jgi:PAS domain-containing protein